MLVRRLLAYSLAIALFAPELAFSQTSDEINTQARAYYHQGRAALRAGKPEAARLVFERAYELRPTPQIAFALGMAEFDMGLYVEAASHMALYMKQAPNPTADEKRTFAEAEQRVAHLRIHVNVDRADIWIDGAPVASTPLMFQPIYVLAGRRTLRVTCEGFQPVEQTYDVVAGKETPVILTLEREATAVTSGDAGSYPRSEEAGPAPTATNLSPTGGTDKVRVDTRAIVVGGGAALTIAAGVLAIVEASRAAGAKSDAEAISAGLGSPSACSVGYYTPCARLGELEDRRRAALDVGLGALIAAAVLGGTTATAWFFWPRSDVHVVPQAHSDMAGIVVSGDMP